MNALPQISPISDMRVHQAQIIEKARRGPVILVERGSRPALVVISPEQWNALAERMEYLEDVAAIYKKKWEIATGQDEMEEVSLQQIEDWLGESVPA